MSALLPVPHRLQLADGYCLPACVQMVLAYWGIEREQADLARQLGTVLLGGTPGPRIKLLSSRTLRVSYAAGTLDDLQAALSAGIPPIVQRPGEFLLAIRQRLSELKSAGKE